MKTFKDLEFIAHPAAPYFDKQAKLDFENGYGVSVICGDGAYTSATSPYEVAIIKDGVLCYDTPITNNVLGYNTESEVTEIMKKVQEL